MIVSRNNDISMIRGDTETITISCDNYLFQDGDIIEMTIRQSINSPVILYKKITSFTDAGAAIISFETTDTQKITPGIYKYDIQLTLSDGTVSTIIPMSNFTFEGDITHE